MSYDLHIVRMSDGQRSKIDLGEWKACIAAESDMESKDFAEIKAPDGSVIKINQEGVTLGDAWFSYRDGEIVIKNLEDSAIVRAINIASKLNARVEGDEGEVYTMNDEREVSVIGKIPAKPWWKLW